MEEILQYYENLLIIQYNDKEKARQTIRALVNLILPENEATNNLLINDVLNAFNIDTAIGTQLDTLGLYVGVDRFYAGQNFDSLDLFGYDDYDDVSTATRGFNTYSTFDEDDSDGVLTFNKIISVNNELSDDDYRLVLKLKIVQNNSNHSTQAIDNELFNFFGINLYMVDNKDMSISYFVPINNQGLIDILLEKNVLPKPVGVQIRNIIQNQNYFKFISYNQTENIQNTDFGFSNYQNFDTINGQTLSYRNIIEV